MSLPPRMRLFSEGSLAYSQAVTIRTTAEMATYVEPQRPQRKRRINKTVAAAAPQPEVKVRRNCIYQNRNLTQPLQDQQPQFRRRRTTEDFLSFCKMILDYENYNDNHEDVRKRHSSSPLGSTGSSTSSWDSTGTKGTVTAEGRVSVSTPDDRNEDGWNEVTCFCKKPFAGRPMIECTGCLTWVHLKCAKLNRNRIPEHWYCHKCRPKKSKTATPSKQSPAKSKVCGSKKRKLSVASKRALPVTSPTIDETPKDEPKEEQEIKKEEDMS